MSINTAPAHTPVKLRSHTASQFVSAFPANYSCLEEKPLFLRTMQKGQGDTTENWIIDSLHAECDTVIHLRCPRWLSKSWDVLAHISTRLEILLNHNHLCPPRQPQWPLLKQADILCFGNHFWGLLFNNQGLTSMSNQNTLTAGSTWRADPHCEKNVCPQTALPCW